MTAYIASSNKELPSIYTAETCEEVQRLLAFVLRCFQASLIALSKFEEPPKSPEDISSFDLSVYGLVASSLILHGLAYSSFIEEHIHQLNPPDPRLLRSYNGKLDDVNRVADEDMNNELEELRQLQPYKIVRGRTLTVTESSSFGQWLRVLSSKIEGVENILGVVSRLSQPISISVVAALSPLRVVQDWREVVKDLMVTSTTSTPLPPNPSPAASLPIPFPITCTHEAAVKIIEGVLTPSSGKLGFSGSIHCEALLAGLMWDGKLDVSFISNH